jgi:zinc protease
MAWLAPPAYEPGDAELSVLADVLAGGKNARLYKRLVYDLQIAQDVSAFQSSDKLSSAFYIIATARPGVTLQQLQDVIQEELDRLKAEPPEERELQRAVNQYESSFLNRLQSLGGKADQLNGYYFYTRNPDYFNEDLARYKALSPNDVQAAVQAYLRDDGRVILGVVPQGQPDLAPQLIPAGQ